MTSQTRGLLACVVDLDLFVDVIEDGFHLVLQAVQLTSFPLQLPLVLLVVFLQLCGKQCTVTNTRYLADSPDSDAADYGFLLNRLRGHTGWSQTVWNWPPLNTCHTFLCVLYLYT